MVAAAAEHQHDVALADTMVVAEMVVVSAEQEVSVASVASVVLVPDLVSGTAEPRLGMRIGSGCGAAGSPPPSRGDPLSAETGRSRGRSRKCSLSRFGPVHQPENILAKTTEGIPNFRNVCDFFSRTDI